MASLPSLNNHGLLEPGEHCLSLDQVGELFGRFQKTDRRLNLFAKLKSLVDEIRAFSFARFLIIDGSFITAKDEPSDIDLVFVVKDGSLPVTTTLNPYEYNALSSRRLRKKYAFDVFVVNEQSEAYDHYVTHFRRVKQGPDHLSKGLVRLDFK